MKQANLGIDPLVALQHPDGSWGCLHSLSQPTPARPFTTEQALRRLQVLGLTRDDPPIQRALDYLHAVMAHRAVPPDRREKGLHWDRFEQMIAAAWIRVFSPQDEPAREVARFWAELMQGALAAGTFDEQAYAQAYRQRIPPLHKGECLISVAQFYMVTLLRGMLAPEADAAFVAHLLQAPGGIYYVYEGCLAQPPEVFASRQTSRYLAALECLAGYRCAPEKLRFAADWLRAHRAQDGWDLGAAARDGIYFPRAASWRTAAQRRQDCTARIEALLCALAGAGE